MLQWLLACSTSRHARSDHRPCGCAAKANWAQGVWQWPSLSK